MPTTELLRVALFEGKHIRKVIHESEWWFSVIDVIEVLTGSDRPRKYWNDLKKKLVAEGYLELSEKIGQLKMPAVRQDLTDEWQNRGARTRREYAILANEIKATGKG